MDVKNKQCCPKGYYSHTTAWHLSGINNRGTSPTSDLWLVSAQDNFGFG